MLRLIGGREKKLSYNMIGANKNSQRKATLMSRTQKQRGGKNNAREKFELE